MFTKRDSRHFEFSQTDSKGTDNVNALNSWTEHKEQLSWQHRAA